MRFPKGALIPVPSLEGVSLIRYDCLYIYACGRAILGVFRFRGTLYLWPLPGIVKSHKARMGAVIIPTTNQGKHYATSAE